MLGAIAPGRVGSGLVEGRALPVGHRFGWIREVFVGFVATGCWPLKAEPIAGKQIKAARAFGAAFGAGAWPIIVALPLINAGFICQHPGSVGLRPVLEVIIEERLHDVAPEPRGGIAFELNFTNAAAFAARLAVVPWAEDKMDYFAAGVLGRQRFEQSRPAVNILLIKETRDDHRRHMQRLFCQHFIHRLLLPKRVIRGVFAYSAPEAELFQAMRCRHRSCGAHPQIFFVSVSRAGPPAIVAAARSLLVVDIIERAFLPKRAVMKPIIPHPAVHHRRERHRHFQRRMRMYRGHQRGETFIRAANGADAAIGFRHVFHQPFDGVVCVGSVIYLGGIERTYEWPRHDVVAFRSMFPADVLINNDVTGSDGGVVHFRHDCRQVGAVVARYAAGRVVWRAAQEHR